MFVLWAHGNIPESGDLVWPRQHGGMVRVRHPPAAPYALPHRYASVCRRVLADLEEAELSAAGDRAPAGTAAAGRTEEV